MWLQCDPLSYVERAFQYFLLPITVPGTLEYGTSTAIGIVRYHTVNYFDILSYVRTVRIYRPERPHRKTDTSTSTVTIKIIDGVMINDDII